MCLPEGCLHLLMSKYMMPYMNTLWTQLKSFAGEQKLKTNIFKQPDHMAK